MSTHRPALALLLVAFVITHVQPLVAQDATMQVTPAPDAAEPTLADAIADDAPAQPGTAPATPAPAEAPAATASTAVTTPAVTASTTAQAAVSDDDALDETLGERQLRVHNTWLGATGGLHVVDAGSGAVGVLRLALGAEFFSTSDFLNANDQNEYAGSSLTLSATVTDFLELFGAVTSHANWNDSEQPQLLQVLGDTRLGAKAFYPVLPWLTVGGDLHFLLFNGIGGIGPSFEALSFGLRGNVSADLRELPEPMPLITRFSLDYFFDNSAQLIEPVEDARYRALGALALQRRDEDRHLLRPVERFALGVNRTDAVDLALGLEVPLRVDGDFFLHPLIEWTLGIPANRQGYSCLLVPTSAGPGQPDGCLDAQGLRAMPSTFSFGARIYPYVRGLSVLFGVDIGLTGTSTFVRELAPNKPYDVLIALAYATDTNPPTKPAPVAVRETPKAPPPPPKARVQGEVLDASNGAAVVRAIVAYPGLDVSAQATNVQGRFVSYELEPGDANFEVSHADYETRVCGVHIAPPKKAAAPAPAPAHGPTSVDSHEPALNPYFGMPPADADAGAGEQPTEPLLVPLRCELTPKPRIGGVTGVVQGPDGTPVAGARVELSGAVEQTLISDALGRFELATLKAGGYTVRVDAEGYLLRLQAFEVAPGQTATVQVSLVNKPKESQVELTKQEVRIRKQIFFNTNSADISDKSHGLVGEVADLLLRNPQVRLVEIQGHTDSTGNPDVNRELSQLRAEAVRAWLIGAGVDAGRMIAKGYGDERPLLPNLTERNRAQNRRVQFIIKEQE